MYKDEALILGENFQRLAGKAIPDDFFEESNDCGWFVPYIVNTAFACELFLKSLASDGKSKVHGHNWRELFDALSAEKKNSILNHPYFKRDDVKGDDEFREKLEEGGKVFSDWRYCFEHVKRISVDIIFLDHLTEVVHDFARKEVSEFEN